jgi:hypothetical protein
MAILKGSDLREESLSAEERLALKWARREGLSYPINIREVLLAIADLREEDLPIAADALLVKPRLASSRPVVFLEKSLDDKRKTFTLAHELGHLVIPWHVGSFACTPYDIDGNLNVEQFATYLDLEREANRFAAQILMPKEFIAELVSRFGEPAGVIEFLQESAISKVAASIRLINLLPPGYIFLQLDSIGNVQKISRSRDTLWTLENENGSIDIEKLRSKGVVVREFPGRNSIIWFDWTSFRHERNREDTEELSTLILGRILGDVGNYGNIQQRVAGVIGAAKNTADRTGVDLYTVFKERFANRDWAGEIVCHPKFDSFLLAKARELEAKG